jgi:hypothetical protein
MLLRFFFDSKRSKGALKAESVEDIILNQDDVPLRNKKNRLELELTLDGEVLDSEMFLPVIRQALVEGAILFSRNVGRVARPDRLCLIEFFVCCLLFLDFLRLLFLRLLLLILDLLDLGFLLVLVCFLLFFILDFLRTVINKVRTLGANEQTFSTSLVTASWMG